MQEVVVPPSSPEAEIGILQTVVFDNSALDTLTLQPEDFYTEEHQRVFRAMLKLREQGSVIHGRTLLDETKGPDVSVTLLAILEDGFTLAHLKDDCRLVREKALKRKAAAGAGAIARHAMNGTTPAEIVVALEALAAELVEPESVPVTLSMSDLLAATEEAQEWTVGKLFPAGGLSLIAGKPGAGKSTLARDMALAVAQGKPWIGREVKQGPVLYLALEEHVKMVGRHMRNMGARADDPLHVRVDPLTDPIAELRAMVKEHQPTLVVIDPMARFLQVANMNDYSEVSAALDPLIRLAHDTGTHICLLHHAKKGEMNEDSYLGSTALSASVDVVLHMDLEMPSRQRSISTIKQRYPDGDTLEPTVVDLDPNTGRVEVTGTKAEAAYRGMAQEIMDTLSAGPMLQKDLLAEIRGNTSEKSRTVIRLEDVGKIKREKQGQALLVTRLESSSTSTSTHKSRGRARESAALPLLPPFRGSRGRANEEGEKVVSMEERRLEELRRQADQILTDDGMRAVIQAEWPTEQMTAEQMNPPPDSPAYYAMMLADLLVQRAMTPAGLEIMNKHGGFQYDPDANAEGVVRCVEALASQ